MVAIYVCNFVSHIVNNLFQFWVCDEFHDQAGDMILQIFKKVDRRTLGVQINIFG